MEKYSSFYSWDRNHVIIFHAYSWHGHVTTFNCKVNQILQKNYSYEFRKKFKVCLDRYLTRISHILHILFMIKQNILYIQRPTIAQIIQETRKKGDFKSSGNFLGKWWDYNACKSYIYIYPCPYWLFSNRSSMFHSKALSISWSKTQHSAILAQFHIHYNVINGLPHFESLIYIGTSKLQFDS